jgi:branched-chain amino acid transport system permease protein
MSVSLLVQALINGLMIGAVFALISVGLTLIWGVMKIINFAHGEFLMIAMYIAYFATVNAGMDPYLTMVITIPALFLIGAAIYQVNIRPVLKDPPMNQILLTLGLSLVLQNLALVFFKGDVLFVQTWYNQVTIRVGNVILELPKLIAFGGSILASGLLYLFLQRTDMGRAIRAASQDTEAAELMGINVRSTYLVAFGLGSACVGVAGSLMIPMYYVSPTVGNFFGLVAFIVVVLGGMGNFLGALVAGLIVGLSESLGAAILPGSLSRVLTYTVFVLFLLFRPQGIFGRRQA